MANNVRITVKSDSGQAKSDMDGVGGSLGGISVGAAAAATAVTALGVAAVAAASSMADAYADVEQAQARIETLFLDNVGVVEGLDDSVRELAVRYGLDLTDAMNAAYDALSAGVPAENIVTFLEENSRAAVGGMVSLSGTVDATTTIINAYKLEAEDAGRVNDVLFATIAKGKTTYEELSRAISTDLSLIHI